MNLDFKLICEGIPEEFSTYLKMIRKLEFEEEPEYSKYINLFDDLFNRKCFVRDYCYDWVEKGKMKKNEKIKENLMYNNYDIYNKVEEKTNLEEDNEDKNDTKNKTYDKDNVNKTKDNCQIY